MKLGESLFLVSTLRDPRGVFTRPVCRLGLATRGSRELREEDVFHALDRGLHFLNWCGAPDALSAAVSGLGAQRASVVVCVQFEARTAGEARSELAGILRELGTDYVDILTFYYVEENAEWEQIIAPGGALEFCAAARRAGPLAGTDQSSASPGCGCCTEWIARSAHDSLQRCPSRSREGRLSGHG
jgi:hypothetical protein